MRGFWLELCVEKRLKHMYSIYIDVSVDVGYELQDVVEGALAYITNEIFINKSCFKKINWLG